MPSTEIAYYAKTDSSEARHVLMIAVQQPKYFEGHRKEEFPGIVPLLTLSILRRLIKYKIFW